MSSMNIGLFGGAFDPPHIGHLTVADTLIHQKLVDEVWFVSVFRHPWAKRLGKTSLTPYKHRVKMLELTAQASQNPAKLHVKHYRGVSYAYNQLRYFALKFPQHKFHWIMGSEYLSKFDDFLAVHPKLLDFPFYIYPREGYPLEPLYKNMTALSEAALVTVSSTEIRALTASGESLKSLVVPEVEKFINQNKLYSSNE